MTTPITTPVQRRTVRVLAAAQVLTGVGVGAGVAAGSLLVADLTGAEGLAGLAQTAGVVGAAVAAGPLAWLSVRSGRRIGLVTGLWIAAAGALVVIGASVLEVVPLVLLGTFGVGVASAVGLQARYAASDLAAPVHVGRDLSMVVWATTVGAVLGPNLMQPAANLAEALGLPPAARLLRIELPLALPTILAGIKTAAVINVGGATLGALVGAGGYGQPILTGIRLDDTALILEGAVPAALLALAAQGLFEMLERAVVPRGLRLSAASAGAPTG
jgi:ABC-type proline/glycine betaine transport system permease subunit